MARMARRRKRVRNQRVGAFSFLLMTMSVLSFSLAAWFYVTVQQRVLMPETIASRVLGRDGQSATAPPMPEAEIANPPSRRAPEAAPVPEAPDVEPQDYQPVPADTADAPEPQPQSQHPEAPAAAPPEPEVRPGPASASTDIAATWSRASRTESSLDMAPKPTHHHQAVRSREGHLAQEVHRFSLGPGLAPALVTAVDGRLVWTIIGVFLLSNLLFITSLGSTEAPLASAGELEP